MNRAVWASVALMIGACEPMEPSSDPVAGARSSGTSSFTEVDDTKPVPLSEVEGSPTEDADPDESTTGSDDPMALLLAARDAQAEAAPEPEPKAEVVVRRSVTRESWDPSQATPGNWGVVVLSTDTVSQPPTAVLGLPDGSSVVASAGDMLPDLGVVVMAVGVNAAQIASIQGMGDRATVTTTVLAAMHPGEDR